jgi:hypothetical protein
MKNFLTFICELLAVLAIFGGGYALLLLGYGLGY